MNYTYEINNNATISADSNMLMKDETVKTVLIQLDGALQTIGYSVRMIADAVYRGDRPEAKEPTPQVTPDKLPIIGQLQREVSIANDICNELEKIKGALW